VGAWGLWAQTERSVVGWSESRLPFDPRGDLAEYRGALRSALRRLHGSPIDGLSVTYLAPDGGVGDVENVGLYNLGIGSYAHLTEAGIACRRAQSDDGRHWLRYEIGWLRSPHVGDPAVFAALETDIVTLHRNADEWRSTLTPHVLRFADEQPDRFTVDVTISGPWSGQTVAGITKPLLDGVVSALLGLGAAVDDVVLSGALPGRRPIQGEPRRLVRLDRGGVAWNPAGDRCQAFRVRVRRARASSVKAEVCGVASGHNEPRDATA
jgi:hypothetical protein